MSARPNYSFFQPKMYFQISVDCSCDPEKTQVRHTAHTSYTKNCCFVWNYNCVCVCVCEQAKLFMFH